MVNIARAGIDKIKLIPPEISQVNMDLMEEIGEVVRSKPREHRYLIDISKNELVGFNKIEVKKSRYKSLKSNAIELVNYNTRQNILPMIEYERIAANLPRLLSREGINNENVNTNKDLIRALKILEEELEELGFGRLDLQDSKVREIEVNYNILISKPFGEYERVVNYIASLRSGYLKVGKGFEGRDYTGLSMGNNEWEIKIYDKKTDVKNRSGLDIEETLRLEFTLKTINKIKAIFGSEEIRAIVRNDFEDMQKALKEKILDGMVEKIYKDIEKQVNHAIEHIGKYTKRGGGASAVLKYLNNHQDSLIDVEVVLEAQREVERSGNYAREGRRTIKTTLEMEEPKKLIGNINKLNEILGMLGYEKILMDLTPTIKKEVEKHY